MSILAIVLVSVVALLAGANIYVYWRNRPKKVQETVYHFQCSNCGRRLKYRARQAGNQGMCPQCRHRCVFPPIPEKELKR
jgi:DNA-directed RNA polymerase subunit RPC12/RpoP